MKPITEWTDQELEDWAARFGGTALVDRIHAEAAEHADLHPMIDGDEQPDRAAVYRTVWRLRIGDWMQYQEYFRFAPGFIPGDPTTPKGDPAP